MTYNQPQYDPRQQPPAAPPQWGPGPQQPQYPPPGYYPPPVPPQNQKPSRKGIWAIGCLGLFGLFILIAALAGSHSPSSSSFSAPQVTQPAAAPSAAAAKPATHSAAPAAARTVATFNGSGEQKTAPFTVAANWAISYSFDCTSFLGGTGNFQVFTYNGDGGMDFGGVSVNDLGAGKSAVTYAYNNAGAHYLDINSECNWSVKVVSQG